jgi:putative sugar O-methyltransferase
MGIKAHIREALNSLFKHYGYMIMNDQLLYEWQKTPSHTQPGYRLSQLPEDAEDYLVKNNHILRELQTRYTTFDSEVTTPLTWTDAYVSPEDVLYFRGDNAYVWQVRERSMNIMAYALTTYYVKAIDKLGLLEKLNEDDYFGIYSFTIDNRLVSRDLLDSIIEIYFLEKHLNISSYKTLSILDIGAGYGRLAHRMVDALPNISEYLCTDAFPISTFISEYYLRFRNLGGKAKVIPLDKIENALCDRCVDIAVNIHSFSECRTTAIEWWLSLLAKHRVKNLMIVPNTDDTLQTNDGIDFSGIVEKYGYKLRAKEPKYMDPVIQQYAINPDYHYLFERRQDESA